MATEASPDQSDRDRSPETGASSIDDAEGPRDTPREGEPAAGSTGSGLESTPASTWLSSPIALTEFLDMGTLREIQRGFTALTRLRTTIRDPEGREVLGGDRGDAGAAVLDHLVTPEDVDAWSRLEAPIVVAGRTLGSIALEGEDGLELAELDRRRVIEAARKLNVPEKLLNALVEANSELRSNSRLAAVQFLYLMANAIARLCYQEYELRQRVRELSALYELSTLLAGQQDLQMVLNTAVHSAAQVMNVKAASVRLLDRGGAELQLAATFNLSKQYLEKGPVLLAKSQLDQAALGGKVVYVEDLGGDERVLYPEDARREGIASLISAGMVYQGKPIGVIRLYTEKPRTFGWFDRNLLTAIAQLMAAAIQKARLHGQQVRSQQVTRQLHLAADVQRRMIPAEMPSLPRFEIAARYLPSFDLGGDFYDFIDFREDGGGGMGVAVGDVVGKGVAASLLMAAVRASLRAYAQDVYDLDEVIRRVNRALCRDTRDNEFATLWYGVLDPEEMRLTYSNGGHEPPLLLRDGRIQKLDAGGMIVGIDPQQQYERAIVHLQPEDRIFIYTDGLLDAFDAAQRRFGRPRAEDAFIQTGHLSAGEALNRIAWELHRHMGATPASDDTTMLIIRALPDATPA